MTTLALIERTAALSVREVCVLLGVNKSTVKRRLDQRAYRFTLIEGNGGPQYRIDLASLPIEAQHRYLAQQLKAQHPPADRRAVLQQLNLAEQAERDVARAAGITRKPRPMPQPPLTLDESQAARQVFENLCDSAQEEGLRRAAVMRHFMQLDQALPKMERYRIAADDAEESITTLRRWHATVKHLAFVDWAPALAPAWGKGRPKKPVADEAMAFIVKEWGCQSQPSLWPIYRRAKKEAEQHGWALPSYKTVHRSINALPSGVRTFLREGVDALDKLHPAMERDYSTLALHEVWCADGRKGDVFCRWPDGYVGRPILIAWQELRSRKVLGWKVGKSETAELARLAFRDAARRASAVPMYAYLDNGMAFAGKALSGGQATRNRFKIKADDPIGVLTMFGIDVIWATPGRGQAKPIESYWNTFAEAEKCAAFAGAYCGNAADNKPEEFDAKKAIPIEQYIAFAAETVAERNSRSHRGNSMGGNSPDAVYAHLVTQTPVRVPSTAQLAWCLMASEQVKLDKQHAVRVLGNRYWCEELQRLDRTVTYTARFNADNANEPLALFDGRRYLCEVPILARTGFRSREAVADHQRAKNRVQRAEREKARAWSDKERAARSWENDPAPVLQPTAAAPPLPSPKVARLVTTPLQVHVDRTALPSKQAEERSQLEFGAAHAKGVQMMLLEQRRRANGG